MKSESNFRLWRRRMGYTQEQAGQCLGLSKSQVANYDAGKDRGTGKRTVPSLGLRIVMAVVVRGETIDPWPE